MNEPDWNLYRTFLAVLQDGSLSSAARRLGLAQPTVARHVEALEADLGVELFLRSRLGLVPTDKAARGNLGGNVRRFAPLSEGRISKGGNGRCRRHRPHQRQRDGGP